MTREWQDRDGPHWWFTPADAAKIAHCSPETIRRWVRDGRLRVRAGRVHIREVRDIQDHMATRRTDKTGSSAGSCVS